MKSYHLKYKPFGERSILIEWPSKINENILYDVLNFKKIIQNEYIKQKVYVKSAYNSILISYTHTIDNINDEILTFKALYNQREGLIKSAFKLWKIPVCYDDEFALDLVEISEQNNLHKSQIIQWHSETIYTVYFIGFLPGFLYLGGLNKNLHFARKKTPRLEVKKGSVAIGGEQTGVYPNQSPGGWNIIGNSPISFFDVSENVPCFAQAGDKIKFVPINFEEYQNILGSVESGTYQLESKFIDD